MVQKKGNATEYKSDKNNEIERQKLIDEGGTETYGKNKNNKKDDDVLIDPVH